MTATPGDDATSDADRGVRVTLAMRVRAGGEAEFERAWQDIAASARHAEGHLRQSLLRDPSDPATYIVTTDWETREAFTRFERSPEQEQLTAPLRRLRESIQVTVHELIAHVEALRDR